MRPPAGAAILCGVLVLTPTTAAAAAVPASTAGLEYVPLGDSYSAG